MFVTHFIDVSHCNDFSLSKDDPRWPLYNDLLLEVYRLARCKHTVVNPCCPHLATWLPDNSALCSKHQVQGLSVEPASRLTLQRSYPQQLENSQFTMGSSKCAPAKLLSSLGAHSVQPRLRRPSGKHQCAHWRRPRS